MSEQKVETAAPAEKENAGLESVMGQSAFSGAGAAGETPPAFQLSSSNDTSSGFDRGSSESASAPMQLQEVPDQQPAPPDYAGGVNRVVGSTDAELAQGQADNQQEGWESEITSITTVDNEAIAHQGLTNPVGDTGERRVQNHAGDVIIVQQLLVMHNVLNAGQVSTLEELQDEDDRHIPAETLAGIRTFQQTLVDRGVIRNVDGIIDPRGTAFPQLQRDPELEADEAIRADRGDRVEFTDGAENFAIETEFADELEGLQGDLRTYMLEMLSIYVGTNRDTRGQAQDGEAADAVAARGNQAGFEALARHISNHTDPGGANGDRSLVGSDNIMTFLTQIGYWSDFGRRASEAAQEEFDFWTDELAGDQRTEGEDRELLERLRAYTYSGNAGVGQANEAAADRWPWSAIFISHVMHQAGAGDTFNYSPSHSQYAGAAYQNTIRPEAEQEGSNEISNMFSADPDIANVGDIAEPVRVGDLIHFTRGAGNARLAGGNIAPALARRQAFLSHSDLVTSIEIYAPDHDQVNTPDGHHVYSAALVAQLQAAGTDYTILAVTVGGNTSDYSVPDNEQGEDARGDWNNSNTAGGKYWPLNNDLTVQVGNAPGNVNPYGVMRLGESVAPAPAVEGGAAQPEGGQGQPERQ